MSDKAKKYIENFYNKQLKFKQSEAEFNVLKKDFNERMQKFFSKRKESKFYFNDENSVTFIETKEVIFDINKLKKKINKKYIHQIVDAKYEINDFEGLVAYLKSCDVDPKVFKTFISKIESVNKGNLEQLYSLGKVNEEDIKDCFEVKIKSSYTKF